MRIPLGLLLILILSQGSLPSDARAQDCQGLTGVGDSLTVESIEALPTLTGFLISPYPSARCHPAGLLSAEAENPEWIAEMEPALLDSVRRISYAPMDVLEVECRTTWCGIVIEFAPDVDESIPRKMGHTLREELRRSFAFRAPGSVLTVGRPDGTSFVAIYLQADL